MPSRAKDWLAERDLEVARRETSAGSYEWACFISHQAAEKAIKAVYQHLGGEARGHDLDGLLEGLASRVSVPRPLSRRAIELGKHYIAPRYPDAHVDGPPFRHYTKTEAERAIRHAEAIVRFGRSILAGP
ncbi:MAG: HEPN domain-containing protein [Chloroflexi bacterium]|nr:HEPN domain-containing protein [Chloroflexota bacterium]